MISDIDKKFANKSKEIKREPPQVGDICAACGEGKLTLLCLPIIGQEPEFVCQKCGKVPKR